MNVANVVTIPTLNAAPMLPVTNKVAIGNALTANTTAAAF